MRRHVPFEAAATDGTGEHLSFGVHQQARTGLTIRRAIDGMQRGECQRYLWPFCARGTPPASLHRVRTWRE
jgi:hypothetical protein